MLDAARLTLTDATGAGPAGATTVTVAVPVIPAVVALIVDVPAATPVTMPVEASMRATAELDEVQATGSPVNALPSGSRAVAVA
ncbi:MAG TPA: hypothetical protein VN650_02335 [Gemmatimonadaceae bacterium]|nr:hypothetical protein [Gemmatimonadaceae bacterium]